MKTSRARTMVHLSRGWRLVVQVWLWALLVAAPAAAQVAPWDQKCILAVNKGAQAIARAEIKAIRLCAHPALGTLASCVEQGVQRTITKVIAKTHKACLDYPPSFGPPTITEFARQVSMSIFDLGADVFGLPLDTALRPLNAPRYCQANIIAAVTACLDARLRSFIQCTEATLLQGSNTTALLDQACLGTGAQQQPDGTFRITGACNTLASAYLAKCGFINLAVAAPGVAAANPADMLTKMNARLKCRVCTLLNDVNGFSHDCDAFDDGLQNESCLPLCGDGIAQAGEQCDDGERNSDTIPDRCRTDCQSAYCGDEVIDSTEECEGNLLGGNTCDTLGFAGGTLRCRANCNFDTSQCQAPPACGDRHVDTGIGETCDDGNTDGGDGCDGACHTETGYGCTGQPSVCQTNCGDGLVRGSEQCDDRNTTSGDGCDATCRTETGYTCTGQPSVCQPNCGDGLVRGNEQCDDGNTTGDDGCSATCRTQTGYSCTGQPSICQPICGDGRILANEQCDDRNTTSGDGCSATCRTERGYVCTGAPSSCHSVCGDGIRAGGEQCDDGNIASGDGCSATCRPESGWACSDSVSGRSACLPVCGDAILRGAETCDDGNTVGGDGCDAGCRVEVGWSCARTPSACQPVCGDRRVLGAETCDDGNTVSGDGCDSTCHAEPGYVCGGSPSVCLPGCGDGLVRGAETCDDGNMASGDGCSANCRVELGYVCSGQPSGCQTVCGDRIVRGAEQCDDGNTTSGDGCDAACRVEAGWTCVGPICQPTCGDGYLIGGEQCDDGNTNMLDGCDSTCRIEPGWFCTGQPSTCRRTRVRITSPANGSFSRANLLTVTGEVTNMAPDSVLIVNGQIVTVGADGRWSTNVPVNPANITNPIRATLYTAATGTAVHDRVVPIWGDGIASTSLAAQSLGLRINNTGLYKIDPLVAALAGQGLNLGQLVPTGMVLYDDCFLRDPIFHSCLGGARVSIGSPPPSFSSFAVLTTAMSGYLQGDITINNIRVDVSISGRGLVPSCSLTMRANAASISGQYVLQPASDPSYIDAHQLGGVGVSFAGFNASFGGICGAPIIGDIIHAVVGNLESRITGPLADFLNRTDGSGHTPIAAAFADALGGISVASALGEGLGVKLEAPFFTTAMDTSGLTLGSNSRVTASFGTGPGQCVPPPGAPHLAASYSVPSAFPSYGARAPVTGGVYDVGIGLSATTLNQLLRAQTECGLMSTTIRQINLGSGTRPITAELLAVLIPQFGLFPPATPFRIDIRPTLAPFVTGAGGPNGSLTGLKVANAVASVVEDDGTENVALVATFDADLGLNLQFLSDQLAITLAPPSSGGITVTILDNPLNVNEDDLVNGVMPQLVSQLLPSLAGSLGSFPLPEFFGLRLTGVEVSRANAFLSVYTSLTPR